MTPAELAEEHQRVVQELLSYGAREAELVAKQRSDQKRADAYVDYIKDPAPWITQAGRESAEQELGETRKRMQDRELEIQIVRASMFFLRFRIDQLQREIGTVLPVVEPKPPEPQKPWERTPEDPGMWGVRPRPTT